MRGLKLRPVGTVRLRILGLALLIVSMLFLAIPSGAQNAALGACVTDAAGAFPSAGLSCSVRIPSNTAPGEYNLVGRCPTSGAPGVYPPTTGSLGVSSNRVNPGQEITPSGTGCLPNSTVDFTLERIGPLVALGSIFTGVASAQATGTRTLTARITVVDPSSTTGGTTTGGTSAKSGSLAKTGTDVAPWLAGGLSTLALGVALVWAGRKRIRRHASQPVL